MSDDGFPGAYRERAQLTPWAVLDEVDQLVHVVCDCDENTALCCTDVSDHGFTEEEAGCLVCRYLDKFACERCGG